FFDRLQRAPPGTVNAVPHSHYPTKDGRWIAIACTIWLPPWGRPRWQIREMGHARGARSRARCRRRLCGGLDLVAHADPAIAQGKSCSRPWDWDFAIWTIGGKRPSANPRELGFCWSIRYIGPIVPAAISRYHRSGLEWGAIGTAGFRSWGQVGGMPTERQTFFIGTCVRVSDAAAFLDVRMQRHGT